MPRYSVKDLILSTTLIALGLGYICFESNRTVHSPIHFPEFLILLLWIGSGISIGAGIAHLFGKMWLGAALGAISIFAFFAYALSALPL
jgi:hypothetical protein